MRASNFGVALRAVTVMLALALLAGAIPFAFPPYGLDQVTLVLVYAIAVLGLNMVSGYAGSISLGHGAFFALGAYTEAILVRQYAWNPYAAIPAAGALCWSAGLAFGFPALRLRGLYLSLATLAMAMTVPPMLKRFEGLTGGHSGIVIDTLIAPKWSRLSDNQWTYFLVLLTAALFFAIAWQLLRGGLGRALLAIRDHEIVANVMGVDPTYYLSLTFAFSSLYAGVAGALYALVIGYVSPDSFTLMLSLGFFVGGVVGGLTSVFGALVGGMFLQYVPVWASDIDKALGGFVYGVTLIAIMFVMPEGFAGLLQRAGPWLRHRLDGKSASGDFAPRANH